MTIEEAREHVGELVIYSPYKDAYPDEGIITSVNDSFVFVRYSGSQTSQATYPPGLDTLPEEGVDYNHEEQRLEVRI